MKQTTQLADGLRPKTAGEAETLTLQALLPHWSAMLWLLGMRPMLRNLLELDLTMSENLVLRQLQRRPITVNEVATELSLTHSAASRTVDRLVRDGFVSRVENPQDRRQKVLTLTAEGKGLMQELDGHITAGIEFMASRLSAEEQAQFRVLIARMVAAHCVENDEADTDEGS